MKDYSKTIIYKIVCNTTGEVYYGHTIQTLAQRLTTHLAPSNKCRSKQILERGDYEMIEVEKYPCANKKEACRREGWYMLNNPHVNEKIAGRTMKEWMEVNKERISQQKKDERKENPEKAREMSRINYVKHREIRCVKQREWRNNNIDVVRAKDAVRNAKPERRQASNENKNKCREWRRTWGGSSWHNGLNQIAIDLFD